jgi:hypothetical protein
MPEMSRAESLASLIRASDSWSRRFWPRSEGRLRRARFVPPKHRVHEDEPANVRDRGPIARRRERVETEAARWDRTVRAGWRNAKAFRSACDGICVQGRPGGREIGQQNVA